MAKSMISHLIFYDAYYDVLKVFRSGIGRLLSILEILCQIREHLEDLFLVNINAKVKRRLQAAIFKSDIKSYSAT